MKIYEALPFLDKLQTIRRSSWPEDARISAGLGGGYWLVTKMGFMGGYNFTIEDIYAEDWEILSHHQLIDG